MPSVDIPEFQERNGKIYNDRDNGGRILRSLSCVGGVFRVALPQVPQKSCGVKSGWLPRPTIDQSRPQPGGDSSERGFQEITQCTQFISYRNIVIGFDGEPRYISYSKDSHKPFMLCGKGRNEIVRMLIKTGDMAGCSRGSPPSLLKAKRGIC